MQRTGTDAQRRTKAMTPARPAPCFKVPCLAFTDSRVDGLPAELCLIQSTSGSHSPSGKSRHPYVVAPDRCIGKTCSSTHGLRDPGLLGGPSKMRQLLGSARRSFGELAAIAARTKRVTSLRDAWYCAIRQILSSASPATSEQLLKASPGQLVIRPLGDRPDCLNIVQTRRHYTQF